MKDTHWLVVAIFAVVGGVAWLAARSVRAKVERRLARGELPSAATSIWTRDLVDTRFGRALVSFVFAPILIASGLIGVRSREARWKQFDYHGIDAVFIGVGMISLGVMLLANYTFPARDTAGQERQSRVILVAAIIFIACFGTALLRNI